MSWREAVNETEDRLPPQHRSPSHWLHMARSRYSGAGGGILAKRCSDDISFARAVDCYCMSTPPPAARKPSNPYTSVGCRGTEPAAEQGRRHVICRWLMESSMTSHACRLHSIHYSRYGLGSPKPGRGAGRYGPVGNLLLRTPQGYLPGC